MSHRPDLLELFSPERVCLVGREKGLRPSNPSSLDLRTGWDLSDQHTQRRVWQLLGKQRPYMVLLEPECTMFSSIHELFSNSDRIPAEVWSARWSAAVNMVSFSMEIAQSKHEQGRKSLFEHPHAAGRMHLEAELGAARVGLEWSAASRD